LEEATTFRGVGIALDRSIVEFCGRGRRRLAGRLDDGCRSLRASAATS
jgi:hypothetical protein